MEQKTVLMVEDDEVIAVILHAMLVGLGYSVTGPVATGEAAIDAVAAIAGAPEDAPGFSYSGSAAAITKAEWSLDSEALNNLRALQRPGSPDLLGKLVASYLKETPPMLERLRDAFERQDPESACRVAHSLKSSSAYLGATHFGGDVYKDRIHGAEQCSWFRKRNASRGIGRIREGSTSAAG